MRSGCGRLHRGDLAWSKVTPLPLKEDFRYFVFGWSIGQRKQRGNSERLCYGKAMTASIRSVELQRIQFLRIRWFLISSLNLLCLSFVFAVYFCLLLPFFYLSMKIPVFVRLSTAAIMSVVARACSLHSEIEDWSSGPNQSKGMRCQWPTINPSTFDFIGLFFLWIRPIF